MPDQTAPRGHRSVGLVQDASGRLCRCQGACSFSDFGQRCPYLPFPRSAQGAVGLSLQRTEQEGSHSVVLRHERNDRIAPAVEHAPADVLRISVGPFRLESHQARNARHEFPSFGEELHGEIMRFGLEEEGSSEGGSPFVELHADISPVSDRVVGEVYEQGSGRGGSLSYALDPFAVPVEQFVVGFRVAYGSSVRIGEPHDCLSGSIGYVGSYAV